MLRHCHSSDDPDVPAGTICNFTWPDTDDHLYFTADSRNEMTQRDYWELEPKERAALSREQVEGFAQYELMRLGVLAVPPLVLEPEPDVSLPERKSYFRPTTPDVRYGGNQRDQWGIAFETQEQTEAFLALKPIRIRGHYLGHESIESAAPWPADGGQFQIVQLAEEAAVLARSESYRQLSIIRERNTKARREHEEAGRKSREALSEMWDDWQRQTSHGTRLQRIVTTWNEYRRLAPDAQTARRFLAKVFGSPEVEEASEWFGVEIPVLDAEFAEAAPAPAAPVQADDGIAF